MKSAYLIISLLIITMAVAGCTVRQHQYERNTSDPTGCWVGMTRCNGDCSDLMIDSHNCGSCDTHCPLLGECVNGSCQCRSGEEVCDNVCRDLQNNDYNCGSCRYQCHSDEYCVRGKCATKY